MGELVFTNPKVLLGGYDFSGAMNVLALAPGADLKPADVFGQGTHRFLPGLRTFQASESGFWQAGTGSIDEQAFAAVGQQDSILTVLPDGVSQGDVAYFARIVQASYQVDGKIGEVLPFTLMGHASRGEGLVRGALETWWTDATTGSASSYGQNLGAVAEGESMYAVLQVLAASGGGSLAVDVESDDAAGFASATVQASFSAATAVGAEMVSAAGPITDTYWRISYSITGGVSPAFTFVVALGIR